MKRRNLDMEFVQEDEVHSNAKSQRQSGTENLKALLLGLW